VTIGRIAIVARPAGLPGGWRPSMTTLVFAGATLAMLLTWGLLALIYSGAVGGQNVLEARGVLSAISSTSATRGPLEVRALLATPEYFALDDRGNAYFDAAPVENLAIEQEAPGYFDVFDRGSESLAVDPEQFIALLVTVNVHEGDVPEPSEWLGAVALRAQGDAVAPLPGYNVVFRSEHHQTVAIQFPPEDAGGRALLDGEGQLSLEVGGLDADGDPLRVSWEIPLAYPGEVSGGVAARVAAGLVGVLAVTAGLLVIFSPCAVHMTAYFLPLVTGMGMKEILDHTGDVKFRAQVASLGIAFVAGFVALYTVFGVLAGFAGQYFSDTEQLAPYIVPLRIITGAVVIFMALQTLGAFRLPFVLSLQLPGRPHEQTTRRGYAAAMIAGMSISVGCLTCVGGSLLASLLIYAGASSSPMMGGLTLFLFSTGMSIPFLMAAFAFQRVLPRFAGARTMLRYSTSVAAAVMLMVGLLIISGNDSVFEQLVS
jgi:cytochrome c-type biogenesis protein